MSTDNVWEDYELDEDLQVVSKATSVKEIELTDEQRVAVEFAVTNKSQVKKIGGLAGTGKTTLLREVLRRLPRYAACAFTGKAADNLRKKGVSNARTIHSLIYKPVDVGHGETEWVRVSRHELFCSGFIVDEASMVSKQIHQDLLSFDRPIIYVGDHGQLEPVGADDFHLMKSPDVTLEQIHRNAGEIAFFANFLRDGGDAREWELIQNKDLEKFGLGYFGDKVKILTTSQLAEGDYLTAADQIICAFNKTRVQLNNVVRDHLGYPTGEPVVGDRIICLQNDRERGLFNGMQGTLLSVDPVRRRLSFDAGDGLIFRGVPYQPSAFGSEKKPEYRWGEIPFDWSYAISAHKSQGSEFDTVLALEQRCKMWSHQRWAYTTASRAKGRLFWVVE